jgi:hypothetical protein
LQQQIEGSGIDLCIDVITFRLVSRDLKIHAGNYSR